MHNWVELTDAQKGLVRYGFTDDDEYTKGYIVTAVTAESCSHYWFPHHVALGMWPAHHTVTDEFCARLATFYHDKQVADTASYCYLVKNLNSTTENDYAERMEGMEAKICYLKDELRMAQAEILDLQNAQKSMEDRLKVMSDKLSKQQALEATASSTEALRATVPWVTR